MRYLAVSLAALALCGASHAQGVDASEIQIRSHYIGEPVSRFLKLEVDARDEVDVCEDHPDRVDCIHLLNAVHGNGRAEISTTIPGDLFHLTDSDARDSINFVVAGGKLVKLTMSVNDLNALTKTLGHASSDSEVPAQNAAGLKWTNHQSAWELPGLYVTIFQDNNPSLTDQRPVLVMESREEHAQDVAEATQENSVKSR